MANPHNVELEAAKFLQKLIQDSKDEPTKLATKLYVILQHMRASGKENSLSYQVISMAMETLIKQYGLDIEDLTSSRLPPVAGTQIGESGPSQGAGSSQRVGVAEDPKASLTGNELIKPEAYSSGRTLVSPCSSGHGIYLGSPSNVGSEFYLFHCLEVLVHVDASFYRARWLLICKPQPLALPVVKSFFANKKNE